MGSNDRSYVERLVGGYSTLTNRTGAEELLSIRERGQEFVAAQLHDGRELGEWESILLPLAYGLDLLTSAEPINLDWKWFAWDDYAQSIGDELSDDGRQLLRFLVEGRPFKAPGIESNGSYYSWLQSNEVERLLDELVRLGETNPEVEDLIEGFHGELCGWLEVCKGKDLLLLAS